VSRGVGRHPTRIIEYFDLIFVRAGELHIHENDRAFIVRAGQTLLLWPHRRHAGTAIYPPDLSFYWLHFSLVAHDGGPITAADFALPQFATPARPDHLTTLFRRYIDDREAGINDSVAASLLILLIFREIARETQPADRERGTSAGVALAQRAEAYIRTHFHEHITVATVARELGSNPNYLSRVYRQTFGRTPTEQIHARRLKHARGLLLDGLENIDEIARASGFDDTGYFRRLFKREQGMTPLAYRRMYARVHVVTE
jgi:AraC-like DNA-binding protein